MFRLFAGYKFFSNHVFPQLEELYHNLKKNGQKPSALMFVCSDARIVPPLFTTARPGELFMLRNIGNIIPPYQGHESSSVAAALEYALENLGIPDIVVCGHSQCGAMKGLLEPQTTVTMPSVTKWLSHAQQAMIEARKKNPKATFEQLLQLTAEANVMQQIENLKTYPIVAKRLKEGRLTLHAWVYEFETGKILSYDARTKSFVPLEESPEFLNQPPEKATPLTIQSKL